MNDSEDILARLLAADEHPLLREEPDVQEAQRLLDADTDLQAQLEEARSFFAKHPALVRIGDMPLDTRKRIEKALEKHSSMISNKATIELSPWTIRTQFAWAAMLVLLLAGMAVLSSTIANRQQNTRQQITYQSQPPADAFRSFAGNLVSDTLPLQKFDEDTTVLVNWLKQNSRATLAVPEKIVSTRKGIGCATLNGPNGKVSLLCFKIDNQLVHLFITESGNLNLNTPTQPQSMLINHRQAMQWNDAENAYLLISHEPDESLPEVFL
jgi:hypothetical protein